MARDIFAAIHEIWELLGFDGLVSGGLHNGVVGDPGTQMPYATLNWVIETKGVQTNMRSIRQRVIQMDFVDRTPGKVQSYLRAMRRMYAETFTTEDEEVIGFTLRDVFVFLDQNQASGAFGNWVGRMQIEFKFLYDWGQIVQELEESTSSGWSIVAESSSSSTTSDLESVGNLFSTSSFSSASSKSSVSQSSKSSLSTTSQSSPSSASSASSSSSSSSSSVIVSHSSSSSSTSSTVEVRSTSSASSSSSSTVIESRSSSSSSLSSLSVSSSSSSSSSSSG